MSTELPQDAAPAAPSASLVGIPIGRRAVATSPAGKPGDITAQLFAVMTSIEPPGDPGHAPVADMASTSAAPVHAQAEVALLPEEDIVAYWRRLRGARRLATPRDLDRQAIALRWPETLLLSYNPAPGAGGPPELTKVTRLGPAGHSGDAVDYTAALTEWVVALGREAIRTGDGIEEIARFLGARGMTPYRAIVLPLAAVAGGPDHILCHIGRTVSAPLFRRRRTRLAA